jgi:hypothetical protein
MLTGPEIRRVRAALYRQQLVISELSSDTRATPTVGDSIELIGGHRLSRQLLEKFSNPIGRGLVGSAQPGDHLVAVPTSGVRRLGQKPIPAPALLDVVTLLDPQLPDPPRPLADLRHGGEFGTAYPLATMRYEVSQNSLPRAADSIHLPAASPVHAGNRDTHVGERIGHRIVRALSRHIVGQIHEPLSGRPIRQRRILPHQHSVSAWLGPKPRPPRPARGPRRDAPRLRIRRLGVRVPSGALLRSRPELRKRGSGRSRCPAFVEVGWRVGGTWVSSLSVAERVAAAVWPAASLLVGGSFR